MVLFLNSRSDIELIVVTQRTIRDSIYGYRSTIDLCKSLGIKFYVPDYLDPDFISLAKKINPDLIICAYYPKIFPAELLKLPPLGCINVHPGCLPKYRGTFPTPWHILNNENEIGITLHYMDNSIDTGDIIFQKKYPIYDWETGHQLYMRSMKLSGELIIESFDKILSDDIKPVKQEHGGSYFNHIEARYQINWSMPSKQIINRIRVHSSPYYPAFTFIFNKCITIESAKFFNLDGYSAQRPGGIHRVNDNGTFLVSTADGLILIEDYQISPIVTKEEHDLHIKVGNFFE